MIMTFIHNVLYYIPFVDAIFYRSTHRVRRTRVSPSLSPQHKIFGFAHVRRSGSSRIEFSPPSRHPFRVALPPSKNAFSPSTDESHALKPAKRYSDFKLVPLHDEASVRHVRYTVTFRTPSAAGCRFQNGTVARRALRISCALCRYVWYDIGYTFS